jgi:hypothetical protein
VPGWAVHLGDLSVRWFLLHLGPTVEDNQDAGIEAEAGRVAVELLLMRWQRVRLARPPDLQLDRIPLQRGLAVRASRSPRPMPYSRSTLCSLSMAPRSRPAAGTP